jgi:histidinol-phosphate aminotransferase
VSASRHTLSTGGAAGRLQYCAGGLRGARRGSDTAQSQRANGLALASGHIRRFLEDAPDRLLVVDEAYVDFGAESAVSLIDEFDNLLVVQTLSKSRALAGMRIGVAFGSRPLIEALERVKDSFNSYPLDVAAQRAAMAAYGDSDWFETQCAEGRGKPGPAGRELLALGFEVLPSAANFLFVRHERVAGKDLFDALERAGDYPAALGQATNQDYLRVTVGTESQCDRLLEALAALLEKGEFAST